MQSIDTGTLSPPVGNPGSAAVVAGVVAGPRPGRLRDLIRLARPYQWPKNLLVVPLALADTATPGLAAFGRMAWAVLLFTLASSIVYVWNDIADRDRDRLDRVKSHRPIAAGRISVPVAGAYAAGLAALLVLAVVAGPRIGWWPILLYLLLNLSYSRWLRHMPLLDVFTVAIGFVLRLGFGYLAIRASPSVWLLTTVFTLCLLLVVGKRRYEVGAVGTTHRPALSGYSAQYLDHLIVMCGVLTVTTFLLYLEDRAFPAPYTDATLLLSVPFALFVLARYLQVVVVHGGGGDPVRTLLGDRVTIYTVLAWGLAFALTATAARFPGLLVLLT